MSQENVEIVHRLYQGFGDGTTDIHLWHTDAELRPALFGGGVLEGAVYRGHKGVAEFLAIQADTWESVIAEPLKIRDLGTYLLVETRIQAVGRVALVARVTAFLDKRQFTEGDEVKKGDLLYMLEQAPFKAQV